MLCKEIISYLEDLSPTKYAEKWDNVGLLAGSLQKEVSCVLIGLDATDELIDHAIQKKVDLIITHHPMIFSPIKRIVENDFIGKRMIKLIQNNISYYTMHTNFDVTVMAEAAAECLNLQRVRILGDGNPEMGFGRIGQLAEVMTLQDCADYVKRCFGMEQVKIFGNLLEEIKFAAIVPGSGKSFIPYAIIENADVLITGDINHHEGLDANMQNLSIIDAGHYGIEHIFISLVSDYLKSKFADITIHSEPIQSPFVIR